MSDTLGESSFAVDHDANFIPLLCNQLDAVYTRYRVSNFVELDDGTRTALQRALELLTTARADTRDRKAGRNIGRVMRQTEEILARYGAAATGVGAEAANGAAPAEEVAEAPAEVESVADTAPSDAAPEAAPVEIADEPPPTETTGEPAARTAALTAEPAAPPQPAGAAPPPALRTPTSFPAYGARTETGPEPVADEEPLRRNSAVVVLAIALVAALAAAGILYGEWHSKDHSVGSVRSQLATTQKQLAAAQSAVAAANAQATSDEQALTQAGQKLSQLQSQINSAKTQLSTTSGQLGQSKSQLSSTSQTVTSLQQQLSAAQAQSLQRENQLVALQSCANDEGAVITYELNGQTATANQALQIAQAVCQRASALGA